MKATDDTIPKGIAASFSDFRVRCPDDLLTLANLYQQAESVLKSVEQRHGEGLVVPAVNELRYAGYHLVQALQAANAESEKSQLDRACKHCRRSIYDSVEVGIHKCLDQFRLFEHDYRLVQIADTAPEYNSAVDAADKLYVQIGQVTHEDRDAYYSALLERYTEFEALVSGLERRRPELNKKMHRRRRAGIATAVGLALTVLIGVFSADIRNWIGSTDANAAQGSGITECVREFLKANPAAGVKAFDYCASSATEDQAGRAVKPLGAPSASPEKRLPAKP